MIRRSGWLPLAVFVFLAGCGGVTPPESAGPTHSAAPSTPAPPDAGPLLMLGLLPADVADVTYTDWAAIRDGAGLEGPADEVRDALFLELLDEHTALSWFAGPQRIRHYQAWGFDAANMDWEVTATLPDGSLIHFVRLSDEVDWGGLIALFDERGYTAEEQGGAVVRSVERDLFIDWQAASDSAMLNVATFDAMRLIVMSDDAAALTATIEVATSSGSSLADSDAVRGTAALLEGTLSGVILMGSDRCLEAGFTPLLPPEIRAEYLSGLRRYEVLGGGYSAEGGRTRGRAVLTFGSEADADADLPARAGLAGSWGQSSGLFVLAGAEISGSSAVLDLGLTGGPAPALDDLRFGGGYTGCV